jgi:hypothetical protein
MRTPAHATKNKKALLGLVTSSVPTLRKTLGQTTSGLCENSFSGEWTRRPVLHQSAMLLFAPDRSRVAKGLFSCPLGSDYYCNQAITGWHFGRLLVLCVREVGSPGSPQFTAQRSYKTRRADAATPTRRQPVHLTGGKRGCRNPTKSSLPRSTDPNLHCTEFGQLTRNLTGRSLLSKLTCNSSLLGDGL